MHLLGDRKVCCNGKSMESTVCSRPLFSLVSHCLAAITGPGREPREPGRKPHSGFIASLSKTRSPYIASTMNAGGNFIESTRKWSLDSSLPTFWPECGRKEPRAGYLVCFSCLIKTVIKIACLHCIAPSVCLLFTCPSHAY